MASPSLIRSMLVAALGAMLLGCSSQQTPYQQRVAKLTRLDAAYLRSCGIKIRKVDPQSGYIEPYREGAAANLNCAYPSEKISPYVAENWTLMSSSLPSASITSYWSGRD